MSSQIVIISMRTYVAAFTLCIKMISALLLGVQAITQNYFSIGMIFFIKSDNYENTFIHSRVIIIDLGLECASVFVKIISDFFSKEKKMFFFL
jgi:hypothetical protein